MDEPAAVQSRRAIERADRNARWLATDQLRGDLEARAARGGVILLCGRLLRSGLQLSGAAVLAHLLSPDDFGVVAMVGAVTAFLEIFADFGLSAATVQREKIDQDTVSALLRLNVLIGIALMLGAWLFAPIAVLIFHDDRVLWLIVVASGALPVTAAAVQHNALLARGMRWATLQATAIGSEIAGLVVGVSLAWSTDLGYWALIASIWTGSFVGLILSWTLCTWRPSKVQSWLGARSAFRFGSYLTGFSFMNFFHRQADDVIVGRYLGAQSLGYYTRAYQLFMLPITALTNPVMGALSPAMYRLQTEPRKMAALYRSAMMAVVTFASAASLAAFFSATAVVEFLFGPAWLASAKVFQILAIAILFQPIYTSVGSFFLAFGRTRTMFLASIPATIIYVSCFAVGAQWGLEGVAYGYVAGMFLVLPWWVALAVRGSGIAIISIIGAPMFSIGSALLAGGATWLLTGAGGPLPADAGGRSGLALLMYCVLMAAVVASRAEYRELLGRFFRAVERIIAKIKMR